MLTAIPDGLTEAFRPQSFSVAPGSEISSEISSEILRLLAAEPTLSARRLGERIGITSRAVEKHLATLQRLGRLLRHGSPRAGRWEVR